MLGIPPPDVQPAPSRAPTMNDLDAVRARFPILAETTYLNSCSLGALSLDATEELGRFLSRWHARGAAAWYEEWIGKLAELRHAVGDLHGASTDRVALLPSTSAALAVVASAIDDPARRRIVVSELDFPTLPYQWMVKPEYEIVRVPSDDGVTIDPARFDEAVDERTLILATSHVCYATGFRQDLGRLADIARRAGALSVIDGYQAPGQIPVDVDAAGVDVYTSGPLKWLCGGPGLSYLVVRDELVRRLEPRITSWFAARDQFAFDATRFEYHDDARRFELGTPSLPSVHLALGAHRLLESIGFDDIHDRVRTLTQRLVALLEHAGFELSIAPVESRTAIVMVRMDDPPAVVRWLESIGIVVDHRPGHVRVSPHFYNTEAELDAFVEGLVRFRAES